MICHITEISKMRGLNLLPDNRGELMQYRLEMAKERLHSSKVLLNDGSYKDSHMNGEN